MNRKNRHTPMETLEARRMLSVAVKVGTSGFMGPVIQITDVTKVPTTDIRFAGANTGQYYTQYLLANDGQSINPDTSNNHPAAIRTAYGVNNILFGAVTGDGTGQTIAIVDAYDDPALVSSTDTNWLNSDLHRFDVDQGLADPPSFTKLTPPSQSTPAYNSGWSGEIALDVEWSHAMAPGANIILVESTDSGSSLDSAVAYAKTIAGVTAISMSWGGGEFTGETGNGVGDDGTFLQTGVTFLSSTGDDGAPGGYPAFSKNVVAVGATNLTLGAGSAYSSETGWAGSGGGISAISANSRPAYQNNYSPFGTTNPNNRRMIPDISIIGGSGSTVLELEDSSYVNQHGFAGLTETYFSVYGTSVSSPVYAGLVAIADQGRVLAGLGTLSGASETLPRLYTLSSTDFHDPTTGSNGFSAGAGYDLVTGRGTPLANLLVPHLAGAADLNGRVFIDKNADGVFDGNDVGLSGVTLYLDINNNGSYDAANNEPTVTTAADGTYKFADQVGGVNFAVRETAPAGYIATTSTTLNSGTTAYDTAINNLNFGLFPTTIQAAAITLKLSGSTEQIYTTATAVGSPEYTIALASLNGQNFTIKGTGASDVLNVDLSGSGVPVPTGNVSYTNTGASDALVITGDNAGDSLSLNTSQVSLPGGLAALYGTLGSITFNLGAGNNTLSLSTTNTPVVANGNSGNDQFLVGGNNLDSQITANVTLNGGAGTDFAFFSDGSGTGSPTYTLSNTSLTKSSESNSYTLSSIDTVSLNMGNTANDTVNLNDSNTSVTLSGNGGNDQFNVDAGVPGQAVTVSAGSGTDSLFIVGTDNADSIAVASNAVSGDATVSFDSTLESLEVDGNDGVDAITVNSTSASTAFTIDGGTSADNIFVQGDGANSVTVVDSLGHDNISVNTDNTGTALATLSGNGTTLGTVSIGIGGTMDFSSGDIEMANLSLTGGTLTGSGDATVDTAMTWNGGTMTGAGGMIIADGATMTDSTVGTSRMARSLEMDGTGSVTSGGNKLLVLSSLTFGATGKLDLTNEDMILDYTGGTQLGNIVTDILDAKGTGTWNGASGLTSSSAAAASPAITTLGAMEATDYKALSVSNTTFDGEPIDNTAVLVKYTYYGDVNFNGKVDGGDYTRMDITFGHEATAGNIGGWVNGDFNYDGKVNGSDYGLADLAFGGQTGIL